VSIRTGIGAQAMRMSYEWGVITEVAIAMALGGFVGFEREVANRPAGFRTHMLVAGAAALLVSMAFSLVERSLQIIESSSVMADPIRIVQAIVIGVSFLGAGTIFRSRDSGEVKGLTTAAALLMSSGIGIAVALRQFVLAVGITALVVVVLRLLGALEGRLRKAAEL